MHHRSTIALSQRAPRSAIHARKETRVKETLTPAVWLIFAISAAVGFVCGYSSSIMIGADLQLHGVRLLNRNNSCDQADSP
jgi:hypothetical protein